MNHKYRKHLFAVYSYTQYTYHTCYLGGVVIYFTSTGSGRSHCTAAYCPWVAVIRPHNNWYDISTMKTPHGHWVSSMTTGRNDGLMWRNHTPSTNRDTVRGSCHPEFMTIRRHIMVRPLLYHYKLFSILSCVGSFLCVPVFLTTTRSIFYSRQYTERDAW